MDGETPTFCKEFLMQNNGCNFSDACSCATDSKFREKSSKHSKQFKKGQSTQIKHKQKFKIKCEDEKYHKKRKHHHSHKYKTKYNINNIYDFIKNHKFNLRNDYDKKHVKKFLSSKEEAFKKVFFIIRRIKFNKHEIIIKLLYSI